MQIETQYGMLNGVITPEYYNTKALKECMLDELSTLRTPCGNLTPKYRELGVRDKYTNAVSFYESGKLKSVYLEEQILVETIYGKIPAELITFYESGKIHRIFPLNGKLTGYWSEEDERKLAEKLTIHMPAFKFSNKLISMNLFESGNIHSITLWNNEIATIPTPDGPILTRIGFSFYENGQIQSLEPIAPTKLKTPIGFIEAYDKDPMGIHGDQNSLVYNKEGDISKIITSTAKIEITDKNGNLQRFLPEERPSLLDLEVLEIVSLVITFTKDSFTIVDSDYVSHTFSLQDVKVSIEGTGVNVFSSCTDCSSCNQCH